jgi:predicted RNase H-like HicB family nuclease
VSESYQVVVARANGTWLAEVPGIEGARAYAKSLFKLDQEVREVIALALDLSEGAESTLELQWEIHTGNEEWDRRTAKVRAMRKAVAKVEQKIAVEMGVAVHQLRSLGGFSARDTAFLTGVSHQRISQIA